MHPHFHVPLERERVHHLWPLPFLHWDHAMVLRSQIDYGTVVQVDAYHLGCANVPRSQGIDGILHTSGHAQ